MHFRFLLLCLCCWELGIAPASRLPAAEPRDPRLTVLAPTRDYRVMGRGDWLLAYNGQTKCPAWTLERIDAETLAVVVSRDSSGRFRSDPTLPRHLRVTPANYLRSGFDQGHCASARYHRASLDELRETFLTSNVMPQYPDVNRVVLRTLEDRIARLAAEDAVIWVLTGPAWKPNEAGKLTIGLIGPAQIWRPTHCVKALLIERPSQPPPFHRECSAWVIDNVPEPERNFDHYLRTTDTAEDFLGLDLWADLPDDEEDLLESQP